jgi:hypothetical protein
MVCTWSQEGRKQHHCGAVAVWLASLEGAPPVAYSLGDGANDYSAGVRPAFASLYRSISSCANFIPFARVNSRADVEA